MNIRRIARHLVTSRTRIRRIFPSSTLAAIEKAIQESEAAHAGEVRFALEGALEGMPLFHDQSPRERALEVFSQLRVWETEHNNGGSNPRRRRCRT